MLQAWLTVVLASTVVLAQEPTCGHCRCSIVDTHVLVNCSDDTYFPGRLRVPKLADDGDQLPLWAEFRRNRYTHIDDDFHLAAAERLSLADNDIFNVSDHAFAGFPALRCLSLARNRLDAVDAGIFHGLGRLQELDLSGNLLTQLPDGVFAELTSLSTLRLASNRIQSVGPALFRGLDKLQTLDLSFNAIVELQTDAFSSLSLLEDVSLAVNLVSFVSADHFASCKKLRSLDLSRNSITKLEADVLKNHASLQKLSLAGNRLTTAIDLPSSVMYLNLSDNHIQGVQNMWKHLDNLEELIVANTSIQSLDGAFNFKHLQVVNVADNALNIFEVESLPAARVVDVSRNNLTEVPSGLTAGMLPSLQELLLDGNPIERLKFPTSGAPFRDLRVLSVSGSPLLQSIDADLLGGVTPRLTSLRLSHNPMLAAVDERAFDGVLIDEVDLSWNALSSLPEHVLPWSQLHSVNLQHNPWDCDCSLQWMLDEVVSRLYVSHQPLLYELRCASPAPLRDRRMVHFYNWTQRAFCMQFEQLRMKPLDGAEEVDTATLGSSTTAIIVVLSLLAALIVMIVVGVLLQRRIASRRRLRNRRF